MCKKAFVQLTQMKPRAECNLMQASLEGTLALMNSVCGFLYVLTEIGL